MEIVWAFEAWDGMREEKNVKSALRLRKRVFFETSGMEERNLVAMVWDCML